MPSHGGRACGNPGAVLGGSLSGDLTSQHRHRPCRDTHSWPGSHGSVPSGEAEFGSRRRRCTLVQQEQDPPPREHSLWVGELGPGAGCVSRAWDTGAAGKRGLGVGVKVNVGGPSRPLPSLSLGLSWQTSLSHCSSPNGLTCRNPDSPSSPAQGHSCLLARIQFLILVFKAQDLPPPTHPLPCTIIQGPPPSFPYPLSSLPLLSHLSLNPSHSSTINKAPSHLSPWAVSLSPALWSGVLSLCLIQVLPAFSPAT